MRYWLSYDTKMSRGDDELFQWLDRMGAKECGEASATFTSDKTVEQIKQELAGILEKHTRIYLNYSQGDGGEKKRRGKFIFGRRKIPPWAGYAGYYSEGDIDEED